MFDTDFSLSIARLLWNLLDLLYFFVEDQQGDYFNLEE